MTTPTSAWLWTKTADTTTRSWLCGDCGATDTMSLTNRSGPYAHVTSTGHTVFISSTHTMTVEGMRIDAGAADV